MTGKKEAKPTRSGNPATRATASGEGTSRRTTSRPPDHAAKSSSRTTRRRNIKVSARSTGAQRRRRTVAAGVAVVALGGTAVSLLAVSTPTPTQTHDNAATSTVGNTNSHLDNWANLIYEAQRFQQELTTKVGSAQPIQQPSNPASGAAQPNKTTVSNYNLGAPSAVAAEVNFSSPLATLTDYTINPNTLRYCLTTFTGEFYATTLDLPAGTTATTSIGTGHCSYTDGEMYTTHAGVVRGQHLLDAIEPKYRAIATEGGPAAVVQEDLSGTHKSLTRAITYAATVVDDYATRHGEQPTALSAKKIAHLGYTLPPGIRLGYYDNRQSVGYRICLTDGTEEAIFESTTVRKAIIRDATGTCSI